MEPSRLLFIGQKLIKPLNFDYTGYIPFPVRDIRSEICEKNQFVRSDRIDWNPNA